MTFRSGLLFDHQNFTSRPHDPSDTTGVCEKNVHPVPTDSKRFGAMDATKPGVRLRCVDINGALEVRWVSVALVSSALARLPIDRAA